MTMMMVMVMMDDKLFIGDGLMGKKGTGWDGGGVQNGVV